MGSPQSKFWRILMYAAFVILIFATITIYVVALPYYFKHEVKFATEYYNENIIHLNPVAYGIFITSRDAIVTLTFWLVAGALVWGKWNDPYRAFLGTVLVLAGSTFPNTLLAEMDNLGLFFVARSVRYLSINIFVLLLYLFPSGNFHPRWLRFPAVLWPVILFLPAFGEFFAPQTFQPELMRDVQAFLILVYVVTGIISQIHRYSKYSEVEERQQTQWVIFGFALVIAGSLIINVGYFLLRQITTDTQARFIYNFGLITVFGATAAIMFSLIFGASILRYRLWDLQPILTRITVFTFVTGVLLILALFVLNLTQLIMVRVVGISTRLETIISIFLLVIIAGPVYLFSRQKITRWVYPKKNQYKKEIENFTNEARVFFDKKAVVQRLRQGISSVLDLDYSRVYEFEPKDDLSLMHSEEFKFALPKINLQVLFKDSITPNFYFPSAKTDKFFVSLVNPQIPGNDKKMGILELGPKSSGKGFSQDEIDFIRSIACEAALALYVAHVQTRITLLAAALESAVNGVALVNAGGSILWVNPAFCALTGFSSESMVGNRFTRLSDVLQKERDTAWETIMKKSAWKGAGTSFRKEGSQYHEELTMTPVINERDEISHIVVIKNDVTERVEIQEKLEHLATHDPLTNLPNRILFNDRLNQALARAKRSEMHGAILYVDLDDFKAINDVYSHEMGDLLLIKIANRMRRTIRAGDTIARIGGDEFALLMLTMESPSDAGVFAERILQIIEKPMRIDGINLQIAGSIGVSIFPEDSSSPSELMRNADIAMYRAKNAGKGQMAYFTEGMSREVEHNLEIRNLLRNAVQNQRLRLVFQPQIDLSTNKMRGVEALLRMEHPIEGTLGPDKFLDLAQKSGLILEIEDWVLDQALFVGNRMSAKFGEPIKMAVNISTKLLFSEGFKEKVQSALSRHDFPAACLELEITENSVMYNLPKAKKVLDQIKALGVQLAIDDFGTGHSSLTHLAVLPFDILKIDRQFTAVLENQPVHAAVFDGIITIARNLGISIIVEGVETESQLNYMENRGISLLQGFYFSKPVPEEMFQTSDQFANRVPKDPK